TDAKIDWGLGAGQVNAEDIPYDNATYITVDAALDHLLGISGTWSDSLEHVVVVAKNGSDASGDGSDKSPFLTINKAVVYGDSLWPSEDFIVLIAPGVYNEHVLITSDHVHLVGMNPKTVIIQDDSAFTVKFDGTSGNSMMWITVKNTGAGGKAIIVNGADDLYFKDVFASATGSGSNVAALELVGDEPEVTIDQGAYQGKKYGIYANPSTGTAVLRIYNASILGEGDDGMHLYNTTAELHSGAVTTNSLTACDINADDNTEILMGAMKYRLGKVCLDTTNGATFEHFILQDRIIDSLMLADNAVVTRTIADASVTGAKIASDAITSDKIVNRDVLGEDIHQDAITNYHIKDGTVLQPEIGWGFGADSISAADMPFDRTIALSHGYTLADSSTQTIIDSIITKLYGVAHGDTVFTRYIVSNDTVFIEDMVATREVATDTIEAFKTNVVYVRDTLYVDNSVEVEQNVYIGHNLLVNHNASVMNNFDVYGNASVMNNFDVYGNVSFYNNVEIFGDLDVGGVISVDTFVTDFIYSTGDTVFVNDFLYVERELVVDSIQAVGDTVEIDDNLLVRGGAKFNDGVDIAGGITVGLDADIGGDLDVMGDISATNGDFSGNLDVTGAASVGGNADITGNTNIGGTLDVTDVATFGDSVGIGGNLGVGGDASIAGNLTVGGLIDVDTLYITTIENNLGDTVYVNDLLYVQHELVVDSIQSFGDTIFVVNPMHTQGIVNTGDVKIEGGDLYIGGQALGQDGGAILVGYENTTYTEFTPSANNVDKALDEIIEDMYSGNGDINHSLQRAYEDGATINLDGTVGSIRINDS
ncbi:MAG: hypothetical protein DRH15_11990, partial [Deltaproteobacteria bacterium]